MSRLQVFLPTLLLGLTAAACDRPADSVVGRWERKRDLTRGRQEWVQFDSSGTFVAGVGSDAIRGTYAQQGATVRLTGNYNSTLTLRDSILVMDDGTEYRRVSTRP
jgi:hypothetical protein